MTEASDAEKPSIESIDSPDLETQEEYDEFKERLIEMYKIFLHNDDHSRSISYSLWRTYDDGREYPCVMNTGGNTIVMSMSDSVGDDFFRPTKTFFDLVGYGFHEVAVSTPRGANIKDLYDNSYPKSREYERWIAARLAYCFFYGNYGEELLPIAKIADNYTNLMPVSAPGTLEEFIKRQ